MNPSALCRDPGVVCCWSCLEFSLVEQELSRFAQYPWPSQRLGGGLELQHAHDVSNYTRAHTRYEKYTAWWTTLTIVAAVLDYHGMIRGNYKDLCKDGCTQIATRRKINHTTTEWKRRNQ